MAANLHISISAEPIIYIGNFPVSNSIFTSLIVSAILISLAIYANSKFKHTKRPQGLQNLLEMILDGLHNLTHDVTNSNRLTNAIFPVTTTFFLFILLNNWLGLLPGVGTIGLNKEPEPTSQSTHLTPQTYAVTTDEHVEEVALENEIQTKADHPPDDNQSQEHESDSTFIPIFRAGSADLNTTIALALFSMFYVQFLGFRYLGFHYLTKFFNFKNVIFTFVGILELVSEFAKIISFAFRLFGNIFAGEVLLTVIASLMPVAMPIPFLFLEVGVGAIQALVFTMLSIVFMTMATQRHGDDH